MAETARRNSDRDGAGPQGPGADRHLTYSFARIGAALKMKDLRPKSAGWELRLHERSGKHHVIPCHHSLAEALRAYIDAAGIADDRKGFLKRAVTVGISAPVGNHLSRAMDHGLPFQRRSH
jgi:hypothetical protein